MPSLSKPEVANIALGHLGIAKTITSLTERSSEARACNRFFALASETAQSRYPWKNGLKRVSLASIVDNDWEDEFPYAYRIPADCKWFRRIIIGVGNVAKGPAFRIVSDSTGEVVLTSVAEAVAEYSIFIDDPAKWTIEQVNATAFKLAALMARTFDEDNASATRKDMEQQYEIEISRAAAKDLNQEEPPDPPKSELETCRY